MQGLNDATIRIASSHSFFTPREMVRGADIADFHLHMHSRDVIADDVRLPHSQTIQSMKVGNATPTPALRYTLKLAARLPLRLQHILATLRRRNSVVSDFPAAAPPVTGAHGVGSPQRAAVDGNATDHPAPRAVAPQFAHARDLQPILAMLFLPSPRSASPVTPAAQSHAFEATHSSPQLLERSTSPAVPKSPRQAPVAGQLLSASAMRSASPVLPVTLHQQFEAGKSQAVASPRSMSPRSVSPLLPALPLHELDAGHLSLLRAQSISPRNLHSALEPEPWELLRPEQPETTA